MLTVQKDTGIFLFSVDQIDGDIEILDYFGLVYGNAIYGANFIKDYFARLSDTFGGRANGYENALDGAIESSLHTMATRAKKLGANAVIGINVTSGAVNHRMLKATAIGTAVRFQPKKTG